MSALLRVLRHETLSRARGTGLFALLLALVVGLGAVAQLPVAQGPRAQVEASLTPAMRAASWVGSGLSAGAGAFTDNYAAARQNAELRQENQRLAAEVAQLQAAQREDSQLRSELGLTRQDHLRVVAATVVARDPDGLDRTLTIDRGSAAGIRPGMGIVAGTGLVGVVRSVTSRSAIVETVADPSLRLAVHTASSGLTGTLLGGPGELTVHLTATAGAQPQPGEGVVTAGGGNLPADLPIGQLSTASMSGQTVAVVPGQVTPFQDPAQVWSVVAVLSVGG